MVSIPGIKVYRDQWVTTSDTTYTILDDFSSRSYNVNKGSASWISSWMETGDDNSPTGGSIQVLSSYYLQIKDKNRKISRSADLASAGGAILSFNYRRYDDLGSQYVALQVSADGGSTWTEIERFSGPGKTSAFNSPATISLPSRAPTRWCASPRRPDWAARSFTSIM